MRRPAARQSRSDRPDCNKENVLASSYVGILCARNGVRWSSVVPQVCAWRLARLVGCRNTAKWRWERAADGVGGRWGGGSGGGGVRRQGGRRPLRSARAAERTSITCGFRLRPGGQGGVGWREMWRPVAVVVDGPKQQITHPPRTGP